MGLLPASALAQPLDTAYGGSRGLKYRKSVNGTIVFRELLKELGVEVQVRGQLGGPGLRGGASSAVDTVFWFPDRFDVPSREEVDLIEDWFAEHPEWRNFVIVLRDFDGASQYWDLVAKQLHDERRVQAEIVAQEYRNAFELRRRSTGTELECKWFRVTRTDTWKRATQLDGPLARNLAELDPGKTGLIMTSTLDPATGEMRRLTRSLLSVDGTCFVMQVRPPEFAGRRLIIVSNGSFLLNFPLANRGNRRIATRLIEYLEPERVMFLESGVALLESGSDPQSPANIWFWMQSGPLRVIIPQCILLFLIYCFAHYPIFGRPREEPSYRVADAGHHIQAAGQLYRESGDRRRAMDTIRRYREVSGEERPRSLMGTKRGREA